MWWRFAACQRPFKRSTHSVVGRHVVVRGAELCHQLVRHLVVGGHSFLLHLLANLHGEMPQALTVLLAFLSTFPEGKHTALVTRRNVRVERTCLSQRTHPDDHGEASDCWVWVRNCELGVCGLFTKMVLDTVGLCGVAITLKKKENIT